MYDYALWTEIDATAKWHLTSLYGPYLLLCELLPQFPILRTGSFSPAPTSAGGWIDIWDGLGFGGKSGC